MKKSLLIVLPLVFGLAACSFEKKGENTEVPSAGTTEGGMAVQPSDPEGEAAEPTAPTPPEATPPVQQ